MWLFSFRKSFWKQIKTIENWGKKQVEALKALKPVENQQTLKSVEGIISKD